MCLSIKIYKQAVPRSFLGKKISVRREVFIATYALLRVISLCFYPAYMVFYPSYFMFWGAAYIKGSNDDTEKNYLLTAKFPEGKWLGL